MWINPVEDLFERTGLPQLQELLGRISNLVQFALGAADRADLNETDVPELRTNGAGFHSHPTTLAMHIPNAM